MHQLLVSMMMSVYVHCNPVWSCVCTMYSEQLVTPQQVPRPVRANYFFPIIIFCSRFRVPTSLHYYTRYKNEFAHTCCLCSSGLSFWCIGRDLVVQLRQCGGFHAACRVWTVELLVLWTQTLHLLHRLKSVWIKCVVRMCINGIIVRTGSTCHSHIIFCIAKLCIGGRSTS